MAYPAAWAVPAAADMTRSGRLVVAAGSRMAIRPVRRVRIERAIRLGR